VRTVADAEMCVAHGVDALGLNFWPESSRHVDADAARRIALAVGDAVALVGLFVDEREARIAELRDVVGFSWVQLHGNEPPEVVARLGPDAYKAIRVGDESIEEEASRYGGPLLLLDALVPGQAGGTGHSFDWELARGLAKKRAIVLAGGLSAANVAEAVRRVGPRAVDVASGVESEPGVKDEVRVAAFVAAVRKAG